MDLDAARWTEILPHLPFADTILGLEKARWRKERIGSPPEVAALLKVIADAADQARTAQTSHPADPLRDSRAAAHTVRLRAALHDWFTFYDGYDPLFTWWNREPYHAADTALGAYADCLKPADPDAIVGAPIGRAALDNELAHELLDATTDELIALGDREYAFCETEMRRASHEMGFGDDWRAALNTVKDRFVAPGEQAQLVRELAEEAIEFVESRDLVTVPPLCRESWRMAMMTPDAQRTSPFFLGGEEIRISFPTDNMAHEGKQMSLRGNNRHFARATVQHELIPGHHLQLFQAARLRPYRRLFTTPFYIEGWALHWEMLLWDLRFAQSPEDRIGMLFWRMHRCARITFSLRFHRGEMTANECVDYLVERVGHERDNAVAEVRRSCGEAYPPLYQCAYLLGGLQMRSLFLEQIAGSLGSESRTPRAFHDAVLSENAIPLPLLRAALDPSVPLTRDRPPVWSWKESEG